MNASASSAYYDFQSLSSLRAQAIKAPDQALEEVAGQFESLFVQMMVKSMRDATIEGGLFESNHLELYQSMLDQQISMDLSSRGVLGLAEILVDQIGPQEADAAATSQADSADIPVANLLGGYAARLQAVQAGPVEGGSEHAAAAVASTSAAVGKAGSAANDTRQWRPDSVEEFVSEVWDHAKNAARELGLDPLVLVAQSALETGWGKRMIKAFDGGNSFNLFGIKAGGTWEGDKATVNTLEYRDGVAAKEQASFRVYDSIASSFNDYVDFLKSNPRYQQALEKVGDAREFVRGLQDAGYATDPNYADKIINIMNTGAVGAALGQLKK